MPAIRNCLLALLLLGPAVAPAVEVGGANLPDSATVERTPLPLNGAGVRSKFFVKVYAAALYLPAPAREFDAVLALRGPKRLLMHFVHDRVERDKLVEAWREGFAANTAAAQLPALQARIDTFNGWFDTLVAGDEVVLDLLADGSTRVTIRDQLRGAIPGADFQRALLAIWLGEHPADASLKRGLLGQDKGS